VPSGPEALAPSGAAQAASIWRNDVPQNGNKRDWQTAQEWPKLQLLLSLERIESAPAEYVIPIATEGDLWP
jgi:hypothetical protein